MPDLNDVYRNFGEVVSVVVCPDHDRSPYQ